MMKQNIISAKFGKPEDPAFLLRMAMDNRTK